MLVAMEQQVLLVLMAALAVLVAAVAAMEIILVVSVQNRHPAVMVVQAQLGQ